eukprot:TRINITY_DN879_c0_g1_i3.p1 TRINITY_DN879_c0_g1~~TRINITY_DN879_c0_g1_i3.p1  ORF type:complete len:352 (-),score=94.13 TRINITY_DN879_c0_g1_i3:266-1321(-)
MEWCTIESDPGVFTEMIENFGVQNVQVEEIYSMDDLLSESNTVYGFIFLFKCLKEKDDRATTVDERVYFARQTVTNACATQAVLSILFNVDEIDIGDELREFKQDTLTFNPDMKGLAIGNSPLIKKVHNSFARPEPFAIEQVKSSKGDAFHFISYVPVAGKLFELDGLKSGPIDLGEYDQQDWVKNVAPIIQKRMDMYSQTEVHFNLMAVVKNKKIGLLEELESLEKQKSQLEERVLALEVTHMGVEETRTELQLLAEKITGVKASIEAEDAKFASWKLENVRRRHNYIPLIYHLLKALAQKDMLLPLMEKAKEKQKLKQDLKKQEQEKKKDPEKDEKKKDSEKQDPEKKP